MPANSSGVKCHIELLGAPKVWTFAGPLSTVKPLVFGAALYLGLNRGRAIRRTELSALLWPDASDAARGERSRWLVHQLRQIGLTGQARAPEIELAVREVVLDIDVLTDSASASDVLAVTRGDVLSGYDPRISDTFSRWIDDARNSHRSTVVRVLERLVTTARRAVAWPQLEELARRILLLDEFHESASVALAEALAMQGRRDASRQVLERHRTGAGSRTESPAVRALRQRLLVVPATVGEAARRGPFAGRQETLAILLDSIGGSRQSSRRIGLAGPAGIGKSRLLDELTEVARLRGARIVQVRCAHGDALRPLSLATDLSRELLEVRGALGANPDSIEALRTFLGQATSVPDDLPNVVRRAAVYEALCDLVGALADEGSVVVVIDDAQWAEPGSWSVLSPLFSLPTTGAISWIVALRAETQDAMPVSFQAIFPPGSAASDQFRETIWLPPLEPNDTAMLCNARVAPRVVPNDVLGVLVARAAGIPFVAEAMADHWMEGGDLASLPPSVARLVAARLDRLSADATSVLETIAVLGPDADLGALEAVCLIERARLLETTRELETAGILRTSDGQLSAHALWTEAVRARAPRTTLQVLHRYAAQWLGHDTAVRKSADHRLHWAIATHWLGAGDPERARHALDRAADVLAANGFSADAAAMLERCAEIAGVSHATLHYWARAASLWLVEYSNESASAVRRLHAQYDRVGRALDPAFSPHHEVEELAHAAAVRLISSNEERDEHLQQWISCVTDATASNRHRLLAASRVFDHHSHAAFERTPWHAVWQATRQIVPITPEEQLEAELCAALYFLHVADSPLRAVAHAESARATLSRDPRFRAISYRRTFLILADCHESAGDLGRAQATRWELYERGKESRHSSTMMLALSGLIGTALEAGHSAEARSLLPLFGPPLEARTMIDMTRTISRVVCALEEGNSALARAELNIPLEHADSAAGKMPRARILAIYAHLALLEHDDVAACEILPRLLECFSGRMAFMQHPAYVTGLCLQRFQGASTAATFVRRFIDEISLERWTPREELLRMARGEHVELHGPAQATDLRMLAGA